MSAQAPVFENALKGAHRVAGAAGVLLVTEDACFRAGEGLSALIEALPRRGTEADFRGALAVLPGRASFEALREKGVLRNADARPLWRRVLGTVLAPRAVFLRPTAQERALRLLGLDPERHGGAVFRFNLLAAAAGAVLSLLVLLPGPRPAAPAAAVALLVAAGMLVHELGHSATAWLLGLGARPIGVSFYLYCPVLFANVSGIRSLGLRGQLAVSLGGFSAQGLYMLALAAASLAFGSAAAQKALFYLAFLLVFNLNPLLHTDGYWCLRDVYERFKAFRTARVLDAAYRAAFSAYTAFLVWAGGAMLVAAARPFLAPGGATAAGTGRLLLCLYVGVLLAQGVRDRVREARVAPAGR